MTPRIDTRTYFIPESHDATRNRAMRKANLRPLKPTKVGYTISQYDWYFKMREDFGTQNEEELA